MSTQDQRVKARIVALRNANDELPFVLIAEMVNDEFELEGKDKHTKDSAQKVFLRYDEPDGESPRISRPNLRPDPVGPVHDENLTDRYRQWLGDSWKYEPVKKSGKPKKMRTVVAVGDLHGNPSADVLRGIIESGPDIIVIGGDSLDLRQASPHVDFSERQRTIKQESAAVRAFFQTLIDHTYADIFVMDGNHDRWLWRKVSDLVPDWMLEFFQDPMDMILNGLPSDRIHRANTVWTLTHPDGTTEEFGDTRFLFVLGDAIFSHLNFTGKQAGTAATKLSKWIDEWRQSLGMPEPSLLVQFHVHRVAQIEERAGWRVLVEPGMGGNLETESYKAVYQPKWNPGALGFLEFWQELDNGQWKTDRSFIRVNRPKRSVKSGDDQREILSMRTV